MTLNLTYALITPAKNEGKFIGDTINSILQQTLLPKFWVIVNDGSTDNTQSIIDSFSSKYPFIKVLNTSRNGDRNFSGKSFAVKIGYNEIHKYDFDFVGNLDADIILPPDYFSRLISYFNCNYRLGIGGGHVYELIHDKYYGQRISYNSVAGAVQFFRRKCYNDVGGYPPLKYGGIDAAAEIIARMKGWDVRTFHELKVYHPRRVRTSHKTIIKSNFFKGYTNYLLGYHPIFQFFLSVYRMLENPPIIGSIAKLAGYFFAKIRSENYALSLDVVNYLRNEQKKRIKSFFAL